MSEINDDQVDLKPYFKIFKKTLKSIENWIYKRIIFVVLVFLVLIGVYYTLDSVKDSRYEVSTIIDKDFISSEQLKSFLRSIQVNINASNSPKIFEMYQNELEGQVKIMNLDYSVITSFKDSLIIERVENSLDELENDGPIKIKLVTNSDSDSIGYLFIDYLNSHPYIQSVCDSKVNFYEERLVSLNNEVNKIDSVISHLLERGDTKVYEKENNGSVISFNENASNIYNLFKHKDVLIREREEVSNKLKFRRSSEVYTIGDICQPIEIEGFTIFGVKAVLGILGMSFFVVLFFSFIILSIKRIKTS